MPRKSLESRRKERQRRRAAVQPQSRFGKGSVVEVSGPATVDHHDPDFGYIKSDHQGAVGRVEDTHFSEERGEMMAAVKLEDEQTRFIPQSRLDGVQADALRPLDSDARRDERERREGAEQRRLLSQAAGATQRVTMPRNSYLPEYTVAALNRDFCSPRCTPTRGRHCTTDHRTNGDPDA